MSLGLEFVGEKTGDPGTFAPVDLLDYVYAALHSPRYREAYKEFLKVDFPRAPYPADAKEFWRLADLGGRLRRAHLLEETPGPACAFPAAGTCVVDGPHHRDDRVYINACQYFENVPRSAWEFHVGGYQPAQKWLKDREGRRLDYEAVSHYQKVVAALRETGRLMAEIDGPALSSPTAVRLPSPPSAS